MTTTEFLESSWRWHPAVLGAVAAAASAYLKLRRQAGGQRTPWRSGAFVAALVLLLLSTESPLETLAAGYLFSAHMLQHLLLLLVVPGLLLLSWPVAAAAAQRARTAPPASRPLWLTRAPVAWLSGVGAMWLWHVPALCNAAAMTPSVRWTQTVSLLLMGLLFWWPIIGPAPQRRLPALGGVVYLFTACVGCTLLGIALTFAPVTVCSAFLHPPHDGGLLNLVRQQWGLTPALDQQVGGLIMWVPACSIYVVASMGLLLRWYGAGGSATAEPAGNAAEVPAG